MREATALVLMAGGVDRARDEAGAALAAGGRSATLLAETL